MQINSPKFYDKRGNLTAYAFACGYTESWEGTLGRLTINHEHGIYHIRGRFNNERVWLTAKTPREARQYMVRIKRGQPLQRKSILRLNECRAPR